MKKEQDIHAARLLTASDQVLIRKLQGQLPVIRILEVLNNRLTDNLGSGVQKFTLEQVYAELERQGSNSTDATDYNVLRKRLNLAKKSGLLEVIDDDLISDFAVIFSLTAKQLSSIKEIVASTKDSK